MSYELIELRCEGDFATITMNSPKRRNALSLKHMLELTDAFREVGESKALGVILAANGPAFCAGHDFADMVGQDLVAMRHLLNVCTTLMETIQAIPQPVLARVHAIATAAGCQLVATCDLAVASTDAAFATPGGKGGWFCTTPMVAVSRNIGRKRALEMLLTGDTIHAHTAAEWGLINRVVPRKALDRSVNELAKTLLDKLPECMRYAKQQLNFWRDLSWHETVGHARDWLSMSMLSDEAKGAIQAFLDRSKN